MGVLPYITGSVPSGSAPVRPNFPANEDGVCVCGGCPWNRRGAESRLQGFLLAPLVGLVLYRFGLHLRQPSIRKALAKLPIGEGLQEDTTEQSGDKKAARGTLGSSSGRRPTWTQRL